MARRPTYFISSATSPCIVCLAVANELDMRPLVAHCHLGLGKLYRRTDTREQPEEHPTTATTMYRAMDMRFWLSRRREMANVG